MAKLGKKTEEKVTAGFEDLDIPIITTQCTTTLMPKVIAYRTLRWVRSSSWEAVAGGDGSDETKYDAIHKGIFTIIGVNCQNARMF